MLATKLTIPGRPVAAVRMTQKSKWTSPQAKRYLAYKDQIGWTARIAGIKMSHSPYHVDAKLFIRFSGKDMDVDNLAKSLMDGLNKIAWHDDRQVTKLTVEKVYVEDKSEERAEIEIKEVGPVITEEQAYGNDCPNGRCGM